MIGNKITLALTERKLHGLSLVIFFSQDVIRTFIAALLPAISYNMTVYMVIYLMYVPLLLSFVLSYKFEKPNHYLMRFLVCLGIVAAVYFVTYLLHPEYAYWFFESSYPIYDRIFRPNQFIYAFLFVSAADDPDDIIKHMKIVAYILLAYYSYRFLKARVLGYWITVTTSAGPVQSTYDLNYGYDHLVVFTTFICCALKEKKRSYLIFAGISFVEILFGGSRGPLIGITSLVLIVFLKYKEQLTKSIRILIFSALVLSISLVILFGIQTISAAIGNIFGHTFGDTSSRTLQMLFSGQSGDLLDNSGRTRLYNIALDMIKNGFWGYGAYGDRYVIGQVYWVGYCHNLFFELLIDYGWVIGGILCILIVVNSFRMLICCKEEAWWICFVIFLIPCTKLLLSGSYWYLEAFWACLAIFHMYMKHVRLENKLKWNQRWIVNKSRTLQH